MPYLILINGASCVGKSSSIKAYMSDHDHLYYLSYDAQKWGFSHYVDHKHEYSGMITDIFFGIAKRVMQDGIDIICDSIIERSTRLPLIDQALYHGYSIIEINLEAPWETIQDRFYQRMHTSEHHESEPISNTSIERLHGIYTLYEQEKHPHAHIVHTGGKSIQEIAHEIEIYIDVYHPDQQK